jgi:hypothetical protein
MAGYCQANYVQSVFQSVLTTFTDFQARTEVVRTPQSSTGAAAAGAAGVSMNSKSSEDSECALTIVSRSIGNVSY